MKGDRVSVFGVHAGRATVLLLEKGSGGFGGLGGVGVLRLRCASLRMTGGRDLVDGRCGFPSVGWRGVRADPAVEKRG